jgi:hypothetical protein
MSFMQDMRTLQNSALAKGGAYVHYSQCLEPTATLISMLPYTEDGICQALSAKWIAEHANDSSLWSWIFAPGSTNVKQSAVANLMINFTESIVRKRSDIPRNLGNRRQRGLAAARLANPTTRSLKSPDLYYQDLVTTKYLGLYGLKRRGITQAKIVGSFGQQRGGANGTKTGLNLAAALHPHALCTHGGAYVLISIMGNGGHAMAAYVGSTDVAFFDPNFGEFWFPDQASFRAWFAEFWKTSGYSREFDSFYLLTYAKG